MGWVSELFGLKVREDAPDDPLQFARQQIVHAELPRAMFLSGFVCACLVALGFFALPLAHSIPIGLFGGFLSGLFFALFFFHHHFPQPASLAHTTMASLFIGGLSLTAIFQIFYPGPFAALLASLLIFLMALLFLSVGWFVSTMGGVVFTWLGLWFLGVGGAGWGNFLLANAVVLSSAFFGFRVLSFRWWCLVDGLEQTHKVERKFSEQLWMALQSLPDTLLLIDTVGHVLNFRDAIAGGRRLKQPGQDKKGITLDRLLPPSVAADLLTSIVESKETTRRKECHLVFKGNPQDIQFEAFWSFVSDRECFLVLREVTSQKAMEQMKNDLITILSHELRTPLTSIHGSLGLLARESRFEISSPAKTLVEQAFRSSEHLVSVLQKILDVEKIEAGGLSIRTRPIPIVPFVRSFLEKQSEPFQLSVFPHEENMLALADEERLSQVLSQLFSNALKFSEEKIFVSVRRTQGSVRLEISDAGGGALLRLEATCLASFHQGTPPMNDAMGGLALDSIWRAP